MLTSTNLVVYLDALFFIAGLVIFITGVLILALRASNNDVKELTQHTAQMVQKGMAEEIAGLVGNAATLVDSMNQLVRTTRGVGIFLVLTGGGMMGLSVWLALQFYRS